VGLATSMQKASPSAARAMRMVRSFSGNPAASAQRVNSRSITRLAWASSVSICSLGPVPTQSLASVSTMPRA